MRTHWGWGATSEDFGLDGERREPVPLEAFSLPAPQLPRPPVPATDDLRARVTCAHGASYMDIVRAFRGEIGHAPDWVLQPRTEADVATALEWAARVGAVVIPRGGGTSVVGGVTPDREGTV